MPESGGVRGWRVGGMFAPLNTWPRRTRWSAILAATLLTTGWSAWLNGGRLGAAWGLPDVYFYVRLALGQMNGVAQPFSSRPLAPLLARWIAGAGRWPIEAGFGILAYVSLLWTLGVLFWLLSRSAAPRWTLLALGAVPFWPELLGYAGLPDPLYAALLAALLVALECEWMTVAALSMFPLMLARESTTLTLLCLLAVGWRRLGWGGSALAVACAGLGALAVRWLGAGSLPNPEHLSGGLYMAGKIASNAFRSLGVVPWSNVYPFLCAAPRMRVPLHFGPVRSVGMCAWSPTAPMQAAEGLLATFGVLPVLLILCWQRMREALTGGRPLLRFCLVYGGVSLLLAPALGTWYARLFGYGWPLLVVAVPQLLGGADGGVASRRPWVALLVLHLLVCTVAERPAHALEMGAVLVLQTAAIALVLVQKKHAAGLHEGGGSDPHPW